MLAQCSFRVGRSVHANKDFETSSKKEIVDKRTPLHRNVANLGTRRKGRRVYSTPPVSSTAQVYSRDANDAGESEGLSSSKVPLRRHRTEACLRGGRKRKRYDEDEDENFEQYEDPKRYKHRGRQMIESPPKRRLSSVRILVSGNYDGLYVYYKKGGANVLRGIIRGTRIECLHCDKVVGISVFEKHAGSHAKKPSDYIYLEDRQISLAELVRQEGHKIQGNQDGGVIRSTTQPVRHCIQIPPSSDNNQRNKKPLRSDKNRRAGSRAPYLRRCLRSCSNSALEQGQQYFDLLFLSPSGLKDGEQVCYMVNGKKYLNGMKQGSGILCECCKEVVSPATFELHAQWQDNNSPYTNIYVAKDQRCLNEIASDLIALKEGIECWRPVAKRARGRPRRVKQEIEENYGGGDSGGCVVCRHPDYDTKSFSGRTVILCDLCDREFHVSCLRKKGIADLKKMPKGDWFCSDSCSRIHDILKKHLKAGPRDLPGGVNVEANKSSLNKEKIQWQILHGQDSKDRASQACIQECVELFEDRFEPVIDPNSNVSLIPLMLNSQSSKDQEYGGMYSAVLKVNSTVVCAAIFRVFGTKVAELPLVATKAEWQGRGYFQELFHCIEELLRSMQVEKLVLPAASDVLGMWQNKFKFVPIPEETFKEYKRDAPILEFQGSRMLEKSLQ